MTPIRRTLPLLAVVLAGLFADRSPVSAQAPGVRIFPPDAGDPDEAAIIEAVEALRASGDLLDDRAIEAQLGRSSCVLELPSIRTTPLRGRELWQAARGSHLRVGWYNLCPNCGRWHLSLSGGYAITADGAVATCAHVVRPDRSLLREGFLIATDDDGRVYPVTEVLALNDRADTAIVRIRAAGLTPLPLNTGSTPGDGVWCYSEPLQRRGYFSEGIINRYVADGPEAPVRIQVSADWMPGSSGSALLDECGNAIGHVARISQLNDRGGDPNHRGGASLVIHEAASAREVLRLVAPLP